MLPLKWLPEAWEEYLDIQSQNKVLLKKVNKLIKEIQRNGYNTQEGSFEMLKHRLTGCASVKANKKDRIVFTIEDETVVIIQCGGHYNDK